MAFGKETDGVRWDVIRSDIRQLFAQLPGLFRNDYTAVMLVVANIVPVIDMAWKGEPMSHPKRKKPGRHERLELVVDHFGNEPFQSARQLYYKEDVADDDILDAFAASVDCFFPPAISRLSPGSQTPQSVS